ncbi:hypothetical protein ACFSTC_40765 [Nonomuraea ferruginea]
MTTFPLERAVEAYHRLENGEISGRAVITPPPERHGLPPPWVR